MTNPLKPCPFCGGNFEIAKHFKEELWRGDHRCPKVGSILIDWVSAEELLVEKWNARAPDPRIAELEGLLKRAQAQLEFVVYYYAGVPKALKLLDEIKQELS